MTTELSTGVDASRRFSPLTWLGLLLRAYVVVSLLLGGIVAAAVGVPVLLWEGCVRLFRGAKPEQALSDNVFATGMTTGRKRDNDAIPI